MLKECLDRLSWRTQSRYFSNQGYSHPTTLWRKRLAADPMEPLLVSSVTQGSGERRAQPLLPWQKLLAALWCASVAAPWWAARHLTKITSGNVCPIKKAFAGPNWTAGKCKTPNKEATGKGVYISPSSRDRWISLTLKKKNKLISNLLAQFW